MAIRGRGPQVVLEGYARNVARGVAGPTMRANIAAMDALVGSGLVADGNSVDGSSRSGGLPYDVVVAQYPHETTSAWEIPAPLLQGLGTGGGDGAFNVRDFGAKGDGVTDDTIAIQAGLDTAAGKGTLVIPASSACYVCAGLVIPSLTHLLIQPGATLCLRANANTSMFFLLGLTTSVIVELYGTLDGNYPNQTLSGSVLSHGIFSGMGSHALQVVSNIAIIGNKLGLITNFGNSAVSLNGATNCLVSGISLTNNAINLGGSPQIAGSVWPPYLISVPISVVSGTYTGATGLVTLTTAAPHGFVPRQEISPINLTGTGGYANAGLPGTGSFADIHSYTGLGTIVVCLPGTAGTTIIYQAATGGADGTIATGWFDYWAFPLGTIASGTFNATPVSGYIAMATVSITTTAPHGLVSGQTVLINVTAGTGTAVTSASGVFVLTYGTTGSTLTYNVPLSGSSLSTSGTISAGTFSVSTKSYKSGFVDCYVDNQHDFGIALYGGCEECYIRNCEVSRASSGPTIYADRNNGRNIACEISGCFAHDCNAAGIIVAVNANTLHLSCSIFDNYVTNCQQGAQIANIDGCDVHDNVFFANKVGAVFPDTLPNTGDVCILSTASRVTFKDNTIRDPGRGGNDRTAAPVSSGTYDSATGTVVLTTTIAPGVFVGGFASFTKVTGTGAVASLAINAFVVTAVSGTSVTFVAASGLGPITITGGQVAPAPMGICLGSPAYCHIVGNFIADYQRNPTMVAGLAGYWGAFGHSEGNTYGPCINASSLSTAAVSNNMPSDLSIYQNAASQGISLDTLRNFRAGLTLGYPFPPAPAPQSFPSFGLTIGRNYGLNAPVAARNEIDFLLGAGQAAVGGFDFIKVITLRVTSGTYTSGTGAVSLVTNLAHGVTVGTVFSISAVTGTGADINKLNNIRAVATAGSAGTTLNYTAATGLDVTSIGGALINASLTEGGVIDSTAGTGGSLFANDGFGNTRIGGALCHGSLTDALNRPVLINGGTVTLQPDTSFVLIRNATSIAAATVILPVASNSQSYQSPTIMSPATSWRSTSRTRSRR